MSKDRVELLSVYNTETRRVIEKIREEIQEDSVFKALEEQYDVYDLLLFNEFSLRDRLERVAFHIKDFRLKYLQEQAKVEMLKDHLDKITGEKYKALKDGELSLTKQEIEKYYLPADEEIIKLKGLLRKQELKSKYFLAVSDAFDKQQWAVKSWISSSGQGF